MNEEEIEKVLKPYYLNWKIKKQIITVFLLTYKRPTYVSLMIESILKQTYSNFYLIILDNASNDETCDIIKSFNDSRIIYIERKADLQKETSNFNYCFSICKTNYLTVFHDDDLLYENYIESVLEFITKNNYNLVSTRFDTIDKDGYITNSSNRLGGNIVYCNHDFLINSFTLLKSHGLLFPATIYDRKFFANINNFIPNDAGPSRDNYLCMQTERYGGTMALLDSSLYMYRVYGEQDSSNHQTKTIMHIQLLNYLFKQSYYSNLIYQYRDNYVTVVRRSVLMSIKYYIAGEFDKKFIKKVYKFIPKQLKYKKTYKYLIAIFINCYFPKVFSSLFDRILISDTLNSI